MAAMRESITANATIDALTITVYFQLFTRSDTFEIHTDATARAHFVAIDISAGRYVGAWIIQHFWWTSMFRPNEVLVHTFIAYTRSIRICTADGPFRFQCIASGWIHFTCWFGAMLADATDGGAATNEMSAFRGKRYFRFDIQCFGRIFLGYWIFDWTLRFQFIIAITSTWR